MKFFETVKCQFFFINTKELSSIESAVNLPAWIVTFAVLPFAMSRIPGHSVGLAIMSRL